MFSVCWYSLHSCFWSMLSWQGDEPVDTSFLEEANQVIVPKNIFFVLKLLLMNMWVLHFTTLMDEILQRHVVRKEIIMRTVRGSLDRPFWCIVLTIQKQLQEKLPPCAPLSCPQSDLPLVAHCAYSSSSSSGFRCCNNSSRGSCCAHSRRNTCP